MYTVQYMIAGYADPESTDVEYHNTLADIRAGLQEAHQAAESYGAGYTPSEAVIWSGRLNDITDCYPDMIATIGPRGGVKFQRL